MMMPFLDPKVTPPPGAATLVDTFLGYVMWAGGAAVVVSLMVLGIVVVLNAYGRAGDHAEIIMKGIGLVFIGGLFVTSAVAIGRVLIPGI